MGLSGKGPPGDLKGKLFTETAYIRRWSIRLLPMKYKYTYKLKDLLVVLLYKKKSHVHIKIIIT